MPVLRLRTVHPDIRILERIILDPSLIPFFQPKGVVVVGASTNPMKPGYGAARNLVECGFSGAIHFVSKNAGDLFGRPIYKEIADVPDPIDLAIIVVPANAAVKSLEDCGKRGIKAAIVLSGGFRELGPEGEALEESLTSVAKAYGIRLIGPNCVGLIDTHTPLNTSFLPPPGPMAGEVAVVSQSGAMLAIIIDWARTERIGFSRLMSLGNKADVDEPDVLDAAVDQEQTRVLALYIEALTDGRRFIEEARKISCKKPIIALKVGRGEAGQHAAASHTGALAGSDIAYQAAFERAGILRAATSDEFFDWIIAFTRCPLPGGRRVAILTNAGGPGVISSDAVDAYGLRLAEISGSTNKSLREFLSPAASFHNPFDMLATASPQDYSRALSLLLEDRAVDSVVILLPAPPMFSAEEVTGALIPLIRASQKPVMIALLGGKLISAAQDLLRESGVAAFPSPERAVAALAALAKWAEYGSNSEDQPLELKITDRLSAEAALKGVPAGSWLDQRDAGRLLTAYGIPCAESILAHSAHEAETVALGLGFPVVVKVASEDISHKSDAGGVRLDVKNVEEAARAFYEIMASAKAAVPTARIEGVIIQRMIPDGQEVIVGAKRDKVFGPVLMFGSGGIEVEGMKDVAFDIAPLTEAGINRLFARTWAGRKLSGFRTIAPADAEATQDVLIRLAQLANDFPQIEEIEINPLRVFAPGSGTVALDYRIKMSSKDK